LIFVYISLANNTLKNSEAGFLQASDGAGIGVASLLLQVTLIPHPNQLPDKILTPLLYRFIIDYLWNM